MFEKEIQGELENFMKKYEEKANTKQFDLILPYIDTEAIFWFSDGNFIGYQEIRGAFEKTWKNLPEEKYTISDVQWLTMTDFSATCIYTFTSESKSPKGPVIFSGRGTNVLAKKSGEWLIIHEHLSLKPRET